MPNNRLALMAAQLFFSGRSNIEISKQLGISATTASRYVKEGRKYAKITFDIPRNRRLAHELVRRYRLKDAIVIETGLDDAVSEIVGHAAARYFLEIVRTDHRVAISCGGTMLAMLGALTTCRHLRLDISQLSAEGDPSWIHQSPSTIAGLLRTKCAHDSTVRGLHLPPLVTESALRYREELASSDLVAELRRDAREADYLFFGVGTPTLPSSVRTTSFIEIANRMVGEDYENRVRRLGLVGEINNQVYDRDGRDRTADLLHDGGQFIHILSLDEIREAAEARERSVVAVAAGAIKVDAIRAALAGRLMNVLVTGVDDAIRLLGQEAPDGDDLGPFDDDF